jgi:hypothetical protein
MQDIQAEIPDYAPPSAPRRWFHNGWFSRSFVLVAGLFFLLPFININCSGTRLATIKGIDLVTGSEIKPEVKNNASDTVQAGEEEEDYAMDRFDHSGDFFEKGDKRSFAPNMLGIMAFASVILTLIFSFFSNRLPAILSGGFALLGALCLFFIQVQVNKEVEAKMGPFNFVPVSFEFTPYYWLCLVFLALASVFAFVRSSVLARS